MRNHSKIKKLRLLLNVCTNRLEGTSTRIHITLHTHQVTSLNSFFPIFLAQKILRFHFYHIGEVSSVITNIIPLPSLPLHTPSRQPLPVLGCCPTSGPACHSSFSSTSPAMLIPVRSPCRCKVTFGLGYLAASGPSLLNPFFSFKGRI